MARRSDGLRTRKRILSSCVRLFLEHGYHHTTMQQIYDDAHVSASSFQNLFGNKDGILMELLKFMYENQFDMAKSMTKGKLPPVYVYAIETCIQLALTEENESVRECYVEAYTCPETMAYINKKTAGKLYEIFGSYQPQLSEKDFLAFEFGTGGMMRGYMSHPCNDEFSLQDKLESFLCLTLRGLLVHEEEVQQVIAFINGLDIRSITKNVMDHLFHALAMHYEFSLDHVVTEE